MLSCIRKHKISALNVHKPAIVSLYSVVYILQVGPLIIILFLFAVFCSLYVIRRIAQSV